MPRARTKRKTIKSKKKPGRKQLTDLSKQIRITKDLSEQIRTTAPVVFTWEAPDESLLENRRGTLPQRRAPMRPIAAHDGDEQPREPTSLPRMLGKGCRLCGVTYPTIWRWMQQATFPRSRAIGSRSFWREDEIAEWLANRPIVRLKCDKAGEVVMNSCRQKHG
jgi:predicted DNA-binding transcriptional regulator AlpA